jgi:hypothetical protein
MDQGLEIIIENYEKFKKEEKQWLNQLN